MSSSFKIAQFNVAMAMRDEKYDYSKFDNRLPEIIKLIENSDPDILFVQEAFRDLPGSVARCHALQVLLSKTYDHNYAYYNMSKLSFGAAVFYKRNKFHVIDQRIIRFHPDQDVKVAVGCQFQHNLSGEKFWAFSTHFAMQEDLKWKSVQKMISELNIQEYPRVIVSGDYNFFEDNDGDKQRSELLKHFDDLAFPLADGYKGTFCGFKHDRYGPKIEQLSTLSLSRLDHIFSRGFKRIGDFAKVEGNKDSIIKQQYPSDHLMITTNVTFTTI